MLILRDYHGTDDTDVTPFFYNFLAYIHTHVRGWFYNSSVLSVSSVTKQPHSPQWSRGLFARGVRTILTGREDYSRLYVCCYSWGGWDRWGGTFYNFLAYIHTRMYAKKFKKQVSHPPHLSKSVFSIARRKGKSWNMKKLVVPLQRCSNIERAYS